MWKWIKNLFKPERQLVLDVEVKEEKMPVEELLQLTKGDRKRLKDQGKIKSIEYPFY